MSSKTILVCFYAFLLFVTPDRAPTHLCLFYVARKLTISIQISIQILMESTFFASMHILFTVYTIFFHVTFTLLY